MLRAWSLLSPCGKGRLARGREGRDLPAAPSSPLWWVWKGLWWNWEGSDRLTLCLMSGHALGSTSWIGLGTTGSAPKEARKWRQLQDHAHVAEASDPSRSFVLFVHLPFQRPSTCTIARKACVPAPRKACVYPSSSILPNSLQKLHSPRAAICPGIKHEGTDIFTFTIGEAEAQSDSTTCAKRRDQPTVSLGQELHA